MDFIAYRDSSSAKALAQRRGVGRLKHVDLRHLWVRSCVRQKLVRLKKVGTRNNRADLNAKNLSVARRQYSFGLCGFSENQQKISVATTTTTNSDILNPAVIRRIALILAGLPVGEAVSLHEVAEGISMWSPTMFVVLVAMMMSGASSVASERNVMMIWKQQMLPAELNQKQNLEVKKLKGPNTMTIGFG